MTLLLLMNLDFAGGGTATVVAVPTVGWRPQSLKADYRPEPGIADFRPQPLRADWRPVGANP